MAQSRQYPIAIIGAGPVGLAAAAHLLERGENPLVIEAGESVGHNVASWAHVRMFSPWEYTVDAAMVRLLEAAGWTMPPEDKLPTGGELVEQFMQPFAELPIMQERIRLNTRVTAVSRQFIDKMKDDARDKTPFSLQLTTANGEIEILTASAVIDASGTWHNPNPLGANGLSVPGEIRHQEHIAYGIPDVLGNDHERYINQRVMVVGSGHSAINALLELGQLHADYTDTQIYWVMRGTRLKKVYGGELDDALPARGALGTRVRQLVENDIVKIVSPFYVTRIEGADDGLQVIGLSDGDEQRITVDQIIGATGARPNLQMVRELRLDLDPSLESTATLAPMIDPNIHSCGTVPPHGEAELRHPEANFYIVGMKAYGRAPSFLLATGYEQVRSVAAHLTGDDVAARDVQLNLPETGVCNTDFAEDSGDACCSPATVTSHNVAIGIGDISIAPVIKSSKPTQSCC